MNLSYESPTVDSTQGKRRAISDIKSRIATVRFLSLSLAGAISADAGLVFVENFVHAGQIGVRTGLDVVVHVAFLNALNKKIKSKTYWPLFRALATRQSSHNGGTRG